MTRPARVVADGVPHHVTQRGNRLQRVFFNDEDYAAYLVLLAQGCAAAGSSPEESPDESHGLSPAIRGCCCDRGDAATAAWV